MRRRSGITLLLGLLGLVGSSWPGPLSAQQPLIGAQRRLQLVPQAPIPLQGTRIGEVEEVVAHPTRPLFFVIDRRPPGVYSFDHRGRFVQRFGRQGEGPHEFLGRLWVAAWQDTLLILDGLRRRVVAYHVTTGAPLTLARLPAPLPAAVQHWKLYREHLIFYWSGSLRPPLVEVYDLKQRAFTYALQENLTPEHQMLLRYVRSGGLTLLGDSLVLAMPADRPVLYFLDLRSGTQGRWRSLSDPAFHAPPLEKPLPAYDFEEWVAYLTRRSSTGGLFLLQNGYLVVQLEHGTREEARWLRLIILDPTTRQEIDRITFPATLRQQYQLLHRSGIFLTAQGNCLYLRRFLEEQDRWALWPWCLKPVPSSNSP